MLFGCIFVVCTSCFQCLDEKGTLAEKPFLDKTRNISMKQKTNTHCITKNVEKENTLERGVFIFKPIILPRDNTKQSQHASEEWVEKTKHMEVG